MRVNRALTLTLEVLGKDSCWRHIPYVSMVRRLPPSPNPYVGRLNCAT